MQWSSTLGQLFVILLVLLAAIASALVESWTSSYSQNARKLVAAIRASVKVWSTVHAHTCSRRQRAQNAEYGEPLILKRWRKKDVFNIDDSVDVQQISELFDKSISGEESCKYLEQTEVIKAMVERVEADRKNLAF